MHPTFMAKDLLQWFRTMVSEGPEMTMTQQRVTLEMIEVLAPWVERHQPEALAEALGLELPRVERRPSLFGYREPRR